MDGVKRISRAVTDDVAVAGGEFRLVGDGEFDHIEALLCRRARAVFVVRVAAGRKTTRSKPISSAKARAMWRWPLWMGSNVPPNNPMFFISWWCLR